MMKKTLFVLCQIAWLALAISNILWLVKAANILYQNSLLTESILYTIVLLAGLVCLSILLLIIYIAIENKFNKPNSKMVKKVHKLLNHLIIIEFENQNKDDKAPEN